jgi:hypothetical protein
MESKEKSVKSRGNKQQPKPNERAKEGWFSESDGNPRPPKQWELCVQIAAKKRSAVG